MHIKEMNFNGDPNLGLYAFATDKYCLTGFEDVPTILKVPVQTVYVINTDFVGLFCSGNSKGVVVPSILEDKKIKAIRNTIDNVLVLETRFSALGNLILLNDKGVVLSPFLKQKKDEIEDFFDLPVSILRIANIDVVGSVAIVTNKGCLTHPQTTEETMEQLEGIFDVEADVGTVSFGSPFLGSGIIANSNGFVVSESTSGPELARIDETLGFLG